MYDRRTGLWRQLWVSDRGNIMDYSTGRVRDGAMHFEGSTVMPQGDTALRRMVFTPVSPDTVRQEIFQSDDGGETWSSVWTGVYVRRAQDDGQDGGAPGASKGVAPPVGAGAAGREAGAASAASVPACAGRSFRRARSVDGASPARC